MARHKDYIKVLEHNKIEIVYGKFRAMDKKCTRCNKVYSTHEEKRTDVNIAIKLLEDAINDDFDIAVLISGDSDLIPAIETAKKIKPEKQFGVIIPYSRPAEELKHVAHFYMKMKEEHLQKSLLDEKVPLNDGTVITCPHSWK